MSRTRPSLYLRDGPRGGVVPGMGLGRSNKYGVGAQAREEFWETVNHWEESLAPQDLGSELSGALGPGRQPEVLALSWHRGECPSWSRPLSVWQAQSLASGHGSNNEKDNYSSP